MKTAITAGIFAALIIPSVTALAADEVKTNGQSEALRLMEQTRAHVQQQNQYRYYAATDTRQQPSQDKTRTMTGADNETGQGDLNRERIRQRDGTGTAQQQTQNQTRNMTGVAKETGQGDLDRDRDRQRDRTGTGDQNKYSQPGSGGGKGAGGGGGRR
jgi:hypothetical protein